MNPTKGWTYLTMDRMQWNKWTRKHRNKFKKRWFAQHGHRFKFYAVEWTTNITLTTGYTTAILHKREPAPSCEV